MEFKDNLRAIRKLRGYTQQELAKQLNYGSSTISNYESGHNQPNIQDLVRMAKILSVSMDCLLGVEENSLEFVEWKTKYDGLSAEQKQELVKFMEFISYRDDRIW